LDRREDVQHLLPVAEREHREREFGALPGELHRERRARGQCARRDAEEPVAGLLCERRGQRIECDGARGELLQPVVLERCAAAAAAGVGDGTAAGGGASAAAASGATRAVVASSGADRAGANAPSTNT